MLERLQRLAVVLRSLRGLLVTLALLSLGLVLSSLLENPWWQAQHWLIPGITGLLWCLVLYSLSFLFLAVPPKPDATMNWRQRVSTRLHRVISWVLAVIFLGLSLALVALSYQLLRIFLL